MLVTVHRQYYTCRLGLGCWNPRTPFSSWCGLCEDAWALFRLIRKNSMCVGGRRRSSSKSTVRTVSAQWIMWVGRKATWVKRLEEVRDRASGQQKTSVRRPINERNDVNALFDDVTSHCWPRLVHCCRRDNIKQVSLDPPLFGGGSREVFNGSLTATVIADWLHDETRTMRTTFGRY